MLSLILWKQYLMPFFLLVHEFTGVVDWPALCPSSTPVQLTIRR